MALDTPSKVKDVSPLTGFEAATLLGQDSVMGQGREAPPAPTQGEQQSLQNAQASLPNVELYDSVADRAATGGSSGAEDTNQPPRGS